MSKKNNWEKSLRKAVYFRPPTLEAAESLYISIHKIIGELLEEARGEGKIEILKEQVPA